MRRVVLSSILASIIVGLPFSAAGASVPQVGAVTNGEFEIAAHQARPVMCLAFGPGYVNVFEPGNPFGLPWLLAISPCQQGVFNAAQWSHSANTQWADYDGDGDREAKIDPAIPDPNIGTAHNMWQAYPNAQQAYVADFEALTFRVEDGAIPPGAYVQISLSAAPLHDSTTLEDVPELGDVTIPASPWLVAFIDCFLTIRSSLLVPNGAGVVSVDPVDASFSSAWEGCNDIAAAWAAGDDDARREILSGLRIVQHSYWQFQSGPAPVVLDGIEILGGKTYAEALIGGLAP